MVKKKEDVRVVGIYWLLVHQLKLISRMIMLLMDCISLKITIIIIIIVMNV